MVTTDCDHLSRLCVQDFPQVSGGSVVMNPPGNAGATGQEDPLGKEMATHSSILT